MLFLNFLYTEFAAKLAFGLSSSHCSVNVGEAREHKLAVSNNSWVGGGGGHFAEHCKHCSYESFFDSTKFFKRANEKTEKEILEAFFIKNAGETSVSAPYFLFFVFFWWIKTFF